MAEINKGEIVDPGAIDDAKELGVALDPVIVKLEKIRRAALESGKAIRTSTSTSDVKNLIVDLQREQEELRKVNQQLQEQIKLLGQQGNKTRETTKQNKNFQKGIIDLLKDVRIGGVSVGQVMDKLEKANGRVFKQLTVGFRSASISAKFFGNAVRTALTLTGIGAIIIALATIVAHWDDIAEAVGLADARQKKFFDAQKKGLEDGIDLSEHQLSVMKALGVEEAKQLEFQIAQTRTQITQRELLVDSLQKELREIIGINRWTGLYGDRIDEIKESYNEQTESIKKAKQALTELLATQARLTIDTAADEKKKADKEAKDRKDARDKEAKAVRDSKQKSAEWLLKQSEEFFKKDLELSAEHTQVSEAHAMALGARQIKVREETAGKLALLQRQAFREDIEAAQAWLGEALEVYDFFSSSVNDIFSQAQESRLQKLEEEETQLTGHYERLIKLAGDNVAERSRLENEFAANMSDIERRRRIEARRTATQDKLNAMFTIGINTAQAVMAFLAKGNLGLSIAAGVIGLAQLAVVASKQIPAFAKGGVSKGGLIKVGEEGSELLFNPNTGKARLSPHGATYTHVEPNTVIVPHKETMQALAYAGLSGSYTGGVVHDLDTSSRYFRELINTIRNKPHAEINITEAGLERFMRNAESKTMLKKTLYR